MSNAQPNPESHVNSIWIDRHSAIRVFVLLAAATFLLRIFYAGHLYQDDGLWFTAAQEIVRGKALYREIYFDKPPLLPLIYAGLFKVFGAHILTIRLFTILYSLTISAVLYKFGSWLYGRREGLVAAAMFTVFSTTFTTGHMQGLNTDFVMVLPYAAGAFFLTRAPGEKIGATTTRRESLWFAGAGGALIGVAGQANPKAVFGLVFFTALLLISRRWTGESARADLVLLAVALAGFVLGALPFLIYLGCRGSLVSYWTYVWDWGARYAHYYSAGSVLDSALVQTLYYFGVNPVLLIALLFVVARLIRKRKAIGAQHESGRRRDIVLTIWALTSYAGLAVGGRFFGHYFFQLLPSLCLIGARGVTVALREVSQKRNSLKYALQAGLSIMFVFSVARFHARTAVLAYDWFHGSRSQITRGWFHDRLNEEEKLVAAAVTDSGGANEIDQNADVQRETSCLFVWGYRPEIYFWSGLKPASRFLSSQPLTGVPADVHYFPEGDRPLLTEGERSRAREQLARELEATGPRFIVDELEFFTGSLGMKNYPELRDVMDRYKRSAVVGRFVIYVRKDLSKGYIKRHREPGSSSPESPPD